MNARNEPCQECISLDARVTLLWLRDAATDNNEWFFSPFDEETPAMLGLNGRRLIDALNEMVRYRLIEWRRGNATEPNQIRILSAGRVILDSEIFQPLPETSDSETLFLVQTCS